MLVNRLTSTSTPLWMETRARRPAVSALTVKKGGIQVSLASANPATVSYAKPSSHPFQNVVCEDAPGFTDEPVTNDTGS